MKSIFIRFTSVVLAAAAIVLFAFPLGDVPLQFCLVTLAIVFIAKYGAEFIEMIFLDRES